MSTIGIATTSLRPGAPISDTLRILLAVSGGDAEGPKARGHAGRLDGPSISAPRRATRVVPWVLAVLLTLTRLASAQAPSGGGTTPGQVRSYSTIHSIGVEWDISGDSNHNATVQAEYRVLGASTWKAALPLVRVDASSYSVLPGINTTLPGFNGFAGSILFLDPDTTYEVKLDLSDPDGGADSHILTIATRPLPTLPTGGRTFHVVPGAGGGDGSAGNPFLGIDAAQLRRRGVHEAVEIARVGLDRDRRCVPATQPSQTLIDSCVQPHCAKVSDN